ncbi:hypothetical protein AAC387_Pa12g0608 [Persea americana]
MAGSSRRWESDPLFSAAEVVQDSADRMESVFRMLLHEQSLVQGDPSDQKLLTSIEYHRRDLATALGTTKWQLEDFERALRFSALSNVSGLRDDSISRHQQFIRAIQEQIILVEKTLEESSTGDLNRNMHWVDLTEHDKDGFASFLSGANSTDHHLYYDSESSIMRRFLDSTSASGFDDKSDEIVEMKTEEIEHSKMNGVKHLEQSYDSVNGNKLRKVGPHSRPLGFESSVSLQVLTGDKECENSRMSPGVPDMEVDTSKNRLFGSQNRVDILGFPCNIWPAFRSKMTRNFTKRRKDGEVTDDYILDVEGGPLSSALDIPQVERNKQAWMGLASGSSARGIPPFDGWANTVKSYSCLGSFQRLFQRFLYFIRYNRFPLRSILAIFATITMLGLLVFRIA